MQREIKFRAWLKDLKTMQVVSELNMWNLGHVFTVDEDNLHYKTSGNVNYTLMQFTGLKDKNGVEIYEGDILKFSNIFDNKGYFKKAVVVYEGSSFQCNYALISGYNTNTIEVIGNKWEDGDLIDS